MDRQEILKTALDVITKGRQDQYGNAEDSFSRIAEYWTVFLRKSLNERCAITADDVAMMMILLKIARSDSNPMHLDNYVDICGYAALAGEMNS